MPHKERNRPRQGTKIYCVPTDQIRPHLLSVAGSGLRGGGLGSGGNNPLLVKRLEERLDDGPVSDLSTLKRGQSRSGGGRKRKLHTRKAGSWSQRIKRVLKAKYHGR